MGNPQPLSSPEICERVKHHYAEIRKVLGGVFGRAGCEARKEKYAYPEKIRRQAWEAECAFNRVMMLEFAQLHVELGLGPVNIRGLCQHEQPDTQVGMTDKKG